MSSQTYEIGGFLGAANYIGDVGKTTFIAPKTSVFGGFLNGTEVQDIPLEALFYLAKLKEMTVNLKTQEETKEAINSKIV